MLTNMVKCLLRNERVRRFARQLYQEWQGEISTTEAGDLAETTPFDCRPSTLRGTRLNLLIPAVSEQHVFGGVATALSLFERLLPHFQEARVVVTDERCVTMPEQLFCAKWPVLDIGAEDSEGMLVVACGNRYGKALAVRSRDVFLATAWWTAYAGFRFLLRIT